MRRTLGRAVTLGAATVIATLIGGSALLLERTWQTARSAAETSLERTAGTIENAVNRQFLQTDVALASLPNLLRSIAERNGSVTASAASNLLQDLNFQTFAFRDLLLVNADGLPWAAARPQSRDRALPVNPAELTRNSETGETGLIGPARNPVTGEWSLFLDRPVAIPGQSSLLGVAEIPLPFLLKVFAEGGALPGLRVMLQRKNGQLVASLPHRELEIGEVQRPSIGLSRGDGRAFDLIGAPKPTLAAARPILYGDMVVVAALDVGVAMADWERDRNRLLAGVGLATLLVCALAGLLLMAVRREAEADAERRRGRAVLENAIEAMSDGFVMWDQDDRLVTCNRRYRELYAKSASFVVPGASFEDIIRKGAENGQYPEAGADIETFVKKTVAWHRDTRGSLERLLPDGRWLLITERRTADGGFVGIRTDITALKQALTDLASANTLARQAMREAQEHNLTLKERDQALHTQNLLFDAALNNMSHGLVMADADQKLIVRNNRFLEIFGVDEASVCAGSSVGHLFAAISRADGFDAGTMETIAAEQQALAAARRAHAFVVASGRGRSLRIVQQPMADGGWVATYEDVTQQRRAEGRIRFLAHHDDLTKLPNRVLFRNQLVESLAVPRSGEHGLALLYLDLDKFKDVNDTLGHPVGDALLGLAARRLHQCLSEDDLVARLGGDEFAVACRSAGMPAAAEELSARIIAALGEPYNVLGRRVSIGVSVGIAIADQGETDPDTLLKNADLALYQAKAAGRGTYRVFEPAMAQRLLARLDLEADLRVALQEGQLDIAYQPIFAVAHERPCGFEALVRWEHPVRGRISPAEFIPLAEEAGLICTLGTWVLRQACADVARLPGAPKVAVNLSPLQLRSADIVQVVADALADTGLEPGRLELEITESALLENNEQTVALLHQLKALGVCIVLDDFGTGYSSLSHLHAFPLGRIKIDQSFVRDLTTRADSVAIVRSVVALATELGMSTTAEGIETPEQLALVTELGCSDAQGYLLGRPESILRAIATLETRPAAPSAIVPLPEPRRATG